MRRRLTKEAIVVAVSLPAIYLAAGMYEATLAAQCNESVLLVRLFAGVAAVLSSTSAKPSVHEPPGVDLVREYGIFEYSSIRA